ncbi:Sir2 silent information regulator family NAD-dependent deacetylase [Enterococcus sp. PF-2]|jgi:NAD-dependent SIR2 family protein deacetylase|uniref:SIR2 family NAD-dependent protein deacylase n=1 Tax=Enterococcus TaxID=1350 RepID=UPI000C79271C|nr:MULTISPECIES: Sir2 silent information regulator family NAD-dependent deacetylase [unclassified Enterococcus]AUJ85633.1 Sir2 silent information regulator family NAD-dependent deacetylase [Enterococcus sp. CR-Ec1]MBO1121586.1 Sir2 silent information regulator family NAD-dependent deacetylase [Enterococcus casseliflavus]TPE02281.1 Sir2 silent information regulator family NAD-dependent deacetylase [Enterococcus sp. PF-3]TPE25370.1 Sir2 silent information regulator family NAD-dependent deacetylas
MKNYNNYQKVYQKITEAEAIVIGAGSGLSAAAGLTYSGERFKKYFRDYIDHYHLTDMYSAGFYPFDSLETYWGYWSKHVFHNRYQPEALPLYKELLSLVEEKNYFVITTNVDHQFQKTGFDKRRLFYTQGDYGLFQCSRACHNKTYENESLIMQMVHQQSQFKIPKHLIPYCPKCGQPMRVNLRIDQFFVQDDGWESAANRYKEFLENYLGTKIVFWEIGIGNNTPSIIKYPFQEMTRATNQSTYIVYNQQVQRIPDELMDKTIILQGNIVETIREIDHFR